MRFSSLCCCWLGQIPDTQSIVADLIGKGGCHVTEVQKKSGALIRVEKYVCCGDGDSKGEFAWNLTCSIQRGCRAAPVRRKDRKVAIMGTIRSNIIAQV